jgi:hypothetical protein
MPNSPPNISADDSSPPRHLSDEPEPNTYFNWQRQLADDKPNTAADLPPQPASSPWAADPVGPEPLIDRSEDSDNFNPLTEGE